MAVKNKELMLEQVVRGEMVLGQVVRGEMVLGQVARVGDDREVLHALEYCPKHWAGMAKACPVERARWDPFALPGMDLVLPLTLKCVP